MAAKRMVIVVNPCGGIRRGLAFLEQVKPFFAEAEIELNVYVTASPWHATSLPERWIWMVMTVSV
jgi:diacylglycerol kinase family enzyme